MADLVLPPSPNWFSPSVSSGSESGLYAFGSKSEIIVYDLSVNELQSEQGKIFVKFPKFVAFYAEHTNKVIGVCLSPDPTQWTCCSCQEDLIQLWDVRSLVTIQEVCLEDIGMENKEKLTCLSWSAADTNTVYASTDKGSILLWHLKSGTLSSYVLSREYIVCIAASPHAVNVAAVGFRTGHAAIVSFENGRASTLQRLRSQEAEIFSISWCPIKGEDFSKWGYSSEEEGALLVVAGRQSLRVWSSLRGKEIFFVKLNPSSVPRRDMNDPTAKKNWVDVVWSRQNPDHIIFSSSGSQGELLYINLQNEKKHEVEKFSTNGINKHTRMIFNIVEVGEKLCTFSLDRTIAVWDNKSKSGLTSFTSFAGSIYCARASPLDPGRIAIGAGDNNIRIWNQNNKSNSSDIHHIYQGIRSKVTYVAWHPTKEGLLAYGMEDGTVGVYNTLSSKAPEVSATFHSKTVYVVSWAPAVKAEKGSSELHVYSVGDGKVLQHFFGQSKRDAFNLMEAIERVQDKQPQKSVVISEMSWRHDYTVFALGRIDGCVAVYAFPSLELLYMIEIQTKLINCIRWHPLTTAQSPAVSPCSSLVAFAGNDYCISIINFKDLLLGPKAAIKEETATKEPVHIKEGQGLLIVGKNTRVTDLCWSPHQDGLLASADYNGVAIVWDAKTMTQLASYKHQSGRLLTLLWSPLDFDTIMTGGTDNTFRKWRVSVQPKEVAKNKKKKRGAAKPRVSEDISNSEETVSTSEIKELEELLKFKEKQLRAQIKTADESLDSHTDSARGASKDPGPVSAQAIHNGAEKNGTNRATTELRLPSPDKSAPVSDADGYPSYTTSAGRGRHRMGGATTHQSDDDNDDAEDAEYGQCEYIPAIEELVPPAKRLFPDKPVSRATSSTANTVGSDGGRNKFSKIKTKTRGLFPVSAAANNRSRSELHGDILDLTRIIAGQDPTDIIDEKPHLGIYTDKLGAHRCLLQESARHLGDAKMDYHLHLEMWRGNVAGAIQLAMQRHELSDWIVAMAPMASRETWETVCRAYAVQLEEDHQYYKAASYLLAVSRVTEAIELFQRHSLYREAISLAKVRLSPIDPVLETLYVDWGAQLLKDGQFEQSAKCFLALRQIHEATQIVTRRQDTAAMRTATHLNLIAQEREQALVYAHKALSQFLLTAQWKEACAFLQEHEGLKVFLPIVLTHELLVEQLSLLCPDLTLTQRPVTADSASSVQNQTSKHGLPEFILDNSDSDPVVPWEPLVLCGDGVARSDDGASEGHGPLHTFPHHLMRVWHNSLNISMMTTDLKAARVAIDHLTKLRPSMMDLPNVLVTVSIDVTSCLFALLAADTSSAINHLLKAMAAIQNSSNISNQHKLLMPALCRLMLTIGPKYLLQLKKEFKALRVLLTMEQDGNLDRAGSEGNDSIRRYLTEIKEGDSISTSCNWYRELDCLRAYYYLAVLDYLQEMESMDEMIRSPGAAAAAGDGASSTQENDSLDGEPKSEGSLSSVPVASNGKQPGAASASPNQLELPEADASNPSFSADLDQNGKLAHSQNPVGREMDTKSLSAEAPKQTAAEPDNLLCKSCDDIKKPENLSSSSKSGSKSPGASESVVSVSSLSAVKPQKAGSSPLESSVDPPPQMPSIAEVAQSKTNKNQSHLVPDALTLSTTSQPLPALTSLSPTGQQSPKKSPGGITPRSHTSSPRNRASSTSSQASPSQHITSIASSPKTPVSRTSTSSTHGHYCRGELTKVNLLKLSRGLLWDTQAKSEVLTETLGYIHKAISQHLLANREPAPSSCNTATAVSSAAGAASHSEEQASSVVAAPTSASPVRSPSSAPQVSSLLTSPKSQQGQNEPSTKASSLSATSSTSGQPQGDSPEEDGSVQQQRRMTTRQSPQSSSGAGHKKLYSTQQELKQKQLSPSGSDEVNSISRSPLTSTEPLQVLKSANINKSLVAPSTGLINAAAAQKDSGSESKDKSSDSKPSSPGFDSAIGIQAERDLLGDLAGEPISFSNSRKVLWLDNNTKSNWQGEPQPLMFSPNGRTMRATTNPWVQDRKQMVYTPEGNSLPLEWDDLPVDEKFNQSYVTMALLKHQQEIIWQELKKGPDLSKVKFPPRSRCVRRLLESCLDSNLMTQEEKKWYIKQLSDWASLFSVTSYQKAETEALFKNIPEEFRN